MITQETIRLHVWISYQGARTAGHHGLADAIAKMFPEFFPRS